MANKLMITSGGALKSVDGIRDSWDFVEAMTQTKDAELYAKVSAVYRAANLTADAFSNMPFAVLRGDTEVDNSGDWKNAIGIMPNPRELLRLWRMSLFFTNQAYGRIARTNSVKRRMFYITPQTMNIITDPMTGEVKEIQRNLGAGFERYKPDDKTLFKMWRLDYTTELLPSKNTEFMALSQSAGILYAADFWTQNYFKNGAVKPTIVSVKGMVTNDKRDELQTSWARFMRGLGTRLAELAKVINADAMDVKQIGDGLGDIKESPVYRQAIENVAMASGMPLSLLLANSANYATAQAEYAAWFRDSITPYAMWVQDELNEQIFQPAGLYLEFRPETAEPSQQEEVERASAFSTYVSAGLKPSVAAQIVGLDLPQGVEYDDLDPEEEPEETVPDTAPAADNTEAAQPDTESTEEDEDEMEDEPTKGLTFEAWKELDIWQRKATKAQKRGEALPMDFVCRHIPDNYADTIRSMLQRGDVGAAFAVKNYEAGINVADVEELQSDLLKVDYSEAVKELAASLDRAAAAAMQPAVKAEPMPQPVINVTMPAITLNANMPAQDAPTVTVNIPEQPAPVVEVKNEIPAPVVNVPPANVVVNIPPREPITAELTTDPRTGKKILKAK